MKLTRTERWMLSNQYRILEAVYPKEAEGFAEARQAIERGYELHYRGLCEHIYADEHTMSETECQEVLEILELHSSLKFSYEELQDKTGIDEGEIRFYGFDGNRETKYVAYTRYFCGLDVGRYLELDRGDHFNSHVPVLGVYRQMLTAWQNCSDRHHLSKDDIARIIAAKRQSR